MHVSMRFVILIIIFALRSGESLKCLRSFKFESQSQQQIEKECSSNEHVCSVAKGTFETIGRRSSFEIWDCIKLTGKCAEQCKKHWERVKKNHKLQSTAHLLSCEAYCCDKDLCNDLMLDQNTTLKISIQYTNRGHGPASKKFLQYTKGYFPTLQTSTKYMNPANMTGKLTQHTSQKDSMKTVIVATFTAILILLAIVLTGTIGMQYRRRKKKEQQDFERQKKQRKIQQHQQQQQQQQQQQARHIIQQKRREKNQRFGGKTTFYTPLDVNNIPVSPYKALNFGYPNGIENEGCTTPSSPTNAQENCVYELPSRCDAPQYKDKPPQSKVRELDNGLDVEFQQEYDSESATKSNVEMTQGESMYAETDDTHIYKILEIPHKYATRPPKYTT
ncbi:uncharacterized protein LOC130644917 [Hydractinia symbiolongicarpus]|uniref:uncharacterized protein LOC130644917 n=1 Tax=Hydractinia symbiolongicarpus TaxID=13093 RepID=UPI0025507BCD|nr:uncharacterized protein LOC130644917 [Hydractinia symbiolongicarpus]